MIIKPNLELTIDNKIHDEVGNDVNSFLEKNKCIYLEANPSYGKTYHFAQVGKEIKSGNSIYNRLIFCTPRLIIQEQIANDLEVDFVLNGDSKLDELKDTDKIITSTFNSLHLIANLISAKDIIVVDEAHELLRNYNSTYKLNPNPYYQKTLQTLHNSSCSLVLMSGTPTDTFHELLGLTHLKIIKKNEDKISINVDFTNLKPKELAYRFCDKYFNEFSKDKLNIIYIKNVNDCGEIAIFLNEKGFNTKALTSKTKEEKVYLDIAKNSTIPEDIQFIITTNVISVGTNIFNTNIGGIAMINEYDPIEIKQFSKRFRKMKNLKIDLANKFSKTRGVSKKKLNFAHNINKKITFKQIEAQKNLSKSIKESELLFFKNMSLEKNDLSSPNYVINQALEKYIANESYLHELKVKTYNTPDKLIKVLNTYHDITASTSDINKSLFKDFEQNISKEAKEIFKSKIASIIDDFLNNKTTYIYYSLSILEYNDFEKREKFRKYIYKHINLLELNLDDKLHKLINSQLFKVYILEPLVEFLPYFHSLDLCLKFIKKTKPEYRKKHILSLYTNQLIHQNFKFKKINYGFQINYKKNSNILQDVNKRDKQFSDIIKIAFECLSSSKSLHVHDFRETLSTDKRIQGIIGKADKNDFPYNMLKDNNLNTNFLLGLANGIFILSYKKALHKDKSGKPRKCFVFEQDLIAYSNHRKFYDTIHVKKKEASKNYTKVRLLKILNTYSNINKIIYL